MTAYYNEFDPGAAAWLRELIRRGLIADGEVDERSILEVQPDDLRGYTQCHFFAGIGGWSYALRLAGWPDDKPVWTGSPPCQPFSSAGQQKGKDDERHLAPHFASLVAAGRPPILFGEQVASSAVFGKAAKRAGGAADGETEWAWIDDLFGRLEAAHYACGASDIPAAGIGAPHIRQRTFFGAVRLAGTQGRLGNASHLHGGDGAAHRGLASAQRQIDCQARQGHGEAAGIAGRNGGLADAGHLSRGDGPEPEGSELNAAARRGRRVDRLADPASAGLEGQRERGSVAAGDGEPGRVGVGPQSGGVGGLADASHDGWQQGRKGNDIRGVSPAQGEARGEGSERAIPLECGSGLLRLADAEGGGCEGRPVRAAGRLPSDGVAEDRVDGGVADADRCGREPWQRDDQAARHGHPSAAEGDTDRQGSACALHGGWADADWLWCRDGKWRPVGPGTFPLAHGLPARVVRLRGYGNAIVPQAAALFVQAFVESLTD